MPDWRSAVRARLTKLRLSAAREDSIVDELAQHLEDRRQDLIAEGVAPDVATELTRAELARADLLAPRLAALRAAKLDQPIDMPRGGHRLLAGLAQDLRYAARALRHDPFVTAISLVTLAFGIGLNTAMFSFMNALLFRPLPFPDAHSLMRLSRETTENRSGAFSRDEYLTLKRSEEAFGRLAGYRPSNLGLSDPNWSTDWLQVSTNLFDVLGVQPSIGRSFRTDDAVAGRDRVVVISYSVWLDRFGGIADVVGRTLRVGNDSYEVIGVLPAAASDQRLFGRVGVFSPMRLEAQQNAEPDPRTINVLGRRRRSLSESQANALIGSIGARYAGDAGVSGGRVGWRADSLPASTTGRTGRAILAMLLGLSTFVLLIACANLANLLLARAIDRTREFAVRAALGASRLQLVRMPILESLLLALGGVAGALGLAVATTRWLQSAIVDGGGTAMPMDWRVLAFAAAAALATVVFCGLAPALFIRRISANDALKSGGRGSTPARGHVRLRASFLVGQFALALILIAGSTFFLRGTRQMLSEHHGWTAERVAQAELQLPQERYPEPVDIARVQRQLLARLERIPGVEAASISYGLPYNGLRGLNHYVADTGSGAIALTARINAVSPAYLQVTGTRLISGRFFDDTDTATSAKVVVVSETLAAQLYPGGNALGRRVAAADSASRDWMEIVGVVADVRSIDIAQTPVPFQLYQPITQDPRPGLMAAVKTTAGAAAAVPALRAAIAEIDSGLTVRRAMTAVESMEDITSSMRTVTALLTGFAVLGLLLSALGIYGAMTRMVVQRTGEIGVRMALGARAADVLGLVFGTATRLIAVGVAIGLAGAIALSRLLASVFPSMRLDTISAALAATATLSAVALLACYIPARRAGHVDPMVALRQE